MKINLFNKLDSVKLNKPGNVLVFEYTGFALYGSWFKCGVKSAVTSVASGVSSAGDLSRAIAEIVEQLKKQSGRKLPPNAVLITPSAASGLIYLPVNPDKPRAKAQMSELVRWEIEPMFARQNGIWFIGALLMGRGYINAKQRQEVAKGAGSNVRFGKYACELGFVSQEQVDECLALQEKLVIYDDEVISGWAPQKVETDDDSMFTWLSMGFGDTMRKQWIKAFDRQNISLRWVYPQIGLTPHTIARNSNDWLLIDIRQEQFAVLRGRPGSLSTLRMEPLENGVINPEIIARISKEELQANTSDIYLYCQTDNCPELDQTLTESLGRPVLPLPLPEQDGNSAIPPQVMVSLISAAYHALGRSLAAGAPRVAAIPPAPPIWKRKELIPMATLILVVLGVIGFDISMRYDTYQNKQALEKLNEEFEEKMLMKKRERSMVSEASGLKAQLLKKQAKLVILEKKDQIINGIILHRQSLLPELLTLIATSTGEEVVLEVIKEDDNRSGFYLRGWATSYAAGQRFVNLLGENLEAVNYRVANMQLGTGRGSLDIQGFTIEIRLEPLRKG